MQLRKTSQRVLIVLTDGDPNGGTIDPVPVKSLQDLNVYRYAVGVGTEVRTDTLIAISGDTATDDSRVYQLSDYSQLSQILFSLSSTSCSNPAVLSNNA